MKGMDQYLEKIHGKSRSRNFYQTLKHGAALTRPRRAGVNAGAKVTGTTAKRKSTDWVKRTF